MVGVETGTRAHIKVCPCAVLRSAISRQVVLLRAGMWEPGRTDGGWQGVMQLWALPAHLPRWKRTVHGVGPRSARRGAELGRVQRGGCRFVSSQTATIKKLSGERHIWYSAFVRRSASFLPFLPLLSGSAAPACSPPLLLCPSHPAT